MLDASLRYASYTDVQLAGVIASMQAYAGEDTSAIADSMRLALVTMKKEQATRGTQQGA